MTELRREWRQLAPYAARAPAAPALGYCSVIVRCASGEEWLVFGGVATYRDAPGSTDHRRDDARRLEKMLLATALSGAVPFGIPGIEDLGAR